MSSVQGRWKHDSILVTLWGRLERLFSASLCLALHDTCVCGMMGSRWVLLRSREVAIYEPMLPYLMPTRDGA